MNCPECNAELTVEMIEGGMCFECGYSFPAEKSKESQLKEFLEQQERENERRRIEAQQRKEKEEMRIATLLENIPLTTTSNIDGHKVKKYIGVESVEIVIGTGIISEFTSDLSDIFGMRSTAFEKKLATAKKVAFDRLKYLAVQKGGDAVLSVDIDYVEFTGNRIGVIVNGTIVSLDPPFISF